MVGRLSDYLSSRDLFRPRIDGRVVLDECPVFINEYNFSRLLCGVGLNNPTHQYLQPQADDRMDDEKTTLL